MTFFDNFSTTHLIAAHRGFLAHFPENSLAQTKTIKSVVNLEDTATYSSTTRRYTTLVDGPVGKHFAKTLSFYLDESSAYLADIKKPGEERKGRKINQMNS
ncbi:MAG: hypothetical protein GY799_30740 [Desulfobulbaceae bacterium]|nr:hypothetical protein [Desulfobulbaceae bacterium]